jgi:capsular polysaccharide transport system permease protein
VSTQERKGMTNSLRKLQRSFAIQRNVIGAIVMRELVTRWGRRNLGFAWLFCEPLVFAFPVIAVWSMVRPPYEHGMPVVAFCWTAYMPLLVFRHVTGTSLRSMRTAASLLYHRRITPFDLFIGRQGLEALGNLASVAFSLAVFLAIDIVSWPQDFTLMMAGFIYTTWWSLCVALFVVCLSERFEIVAHIWPPISYLYMFFSGFFFMADWLSADLRHIALAIDPPLHCYEMIRGGMFGNRIVVHYDIPYLTFILATLTLIGLWLLRDVRQYIELE